MLNIIAFAATVPALSYIKIAIAALALIAAGFISSNDKVKILGNGSVSKALAVTAHAFSKSAEAAIVAAGGSVEKM